MKFLIVFCIFFCFNGAFGQKVKKDSVVSKVLIGLHYGANATFGDLKDRYGYMNHLGGMWGYKTNKNFTITLNGNFSFGRKINMPDVLAQLRDNKGNINDVNGDVAIIVLQQRGFNLGIGFGKIIPVFKRNVNAGIMLNIGIGYTQNKLRIETQNNVVPQIELSYKKGYDRYTTGIGVEQFVGYMFNSRSQLISFYAGFYAQEGFTKNRRELFFDQPNIPVDKKLRLDGQYGVKIGWFIPANKRKPKDFYFE
jgi:hypothetical protein